MSVKHLIRRCDSRCHNAKGTQCNCWCNGRYHGMGNISALRSFLKSEEYRFESSVNKKIGLVEVNNEIVYFNKSK